MKNLISGRKLLQTQKPAPSGADFSARSLIDDLLELKHMRTQTIASQRSEYNASDKSTGFHKL